MPSLFYSRGLLEFEVAADEFEIELEKTNAPTVRLRGQVDVAGADEDARLHGGRDLGAVVVRDAVAPNLRALAVDLCSKVANLVVQVIEGFETMQPVFLSNTSAFSLSTPRPFYFLLPRHHAEEGKMP